MSQTLRRPRFLKPNKAEYPASQFTGWNATLVDDNGLLVRLVAMSEAEFATMPAEARHERGVPTMVCYHPASRTVEVYPVPDREYDIVTETKSWSVG